MRKIATFFLFYAFLSVPIFAAASAQDMRDARDRIIERLPELENLWNRGLTGENYKGYVTARSSLNSTQIQLIQAENEDRLILFSYVAERTGTDHFQVGRQRAIAVSNMMKSGLWVQESNGDWTRK